MFKPYTELPQWSVNFFKKLWNVDHSGFEYFIGTLLHFANTLKSFDLLWQFLSFILSNDPLIAVDQRSYIHKSSLVIKRSKFDECRCGESDRNRIKECIEILINQFKIHFPQSRKLKYEAIWEWQTSSRQKTNLPYSPEQSLQIEKYYKRGSGECHINGLSPILAPLGHIIQFNRKSQIHVQINKSTNHSRQVKRTKYINNLRYLSWLIALQKTVIFLQSQPNNILDKERYISEIEYILQVHYILKPKL